MDSLHLEIKESFGRGERPDDGELVLWDGLDQPTKEDAVRFYSGKTWSDVLTHLRNLKDEPVFGGAYYLEEWSVLTPVALAYYSRAYLEFLFETLGCAECDEEFVFYLLGALRQIFYMHKGSPLDEARTDLLRRVVRRIGDMAAALEAFDYFVDDIERAAKELLAEMEAQDG